MIIPGSVECDFVGGPLHGEIHLVDMQGDTDGPVLTIGLPGVVSMYLPMYDRPEYYRLRPVKLAALIQGGVMTAVAEGEGRPQYEHVPRGALKHLPGCGPCERARPWTAEEYEAHLAHGGDRPEVIAE